LADETSRVRVGPGIDVGPGWSHHLGVSLRYGLGEPLLVAGCAGLAVLWVRNGRKAALLSGFPLTYYAVAGSSHTAFARYAVPLVPFFCLFAATLVVRLSARLGGGWRSLVLMAMLALAIALPSTLSVVRFDRLLARTDSRLLAARWIEAHVPAGSS